MSTISFELPQHPMSEQHEALLSTSDTIFQLVNLDELSLDFLPDVIILDNHRYRYSGTEYGRGIYRKEENPSGWVDEMGIDDMYAEAMVSRRDYGHVEKGSLVEVEVGPLLANPQCNICKVLSDKLSSMLDNPPGYEGIKVGNDFFGNKYIDYGWQEAIRRLQSFMTEHGYKS